MSSDEFTYTFDLNTNEVTNQCNLCPTEVSKNIAHWLYAENNKYDEDSIDDAKVGKWMLFLSEDVVNAAWDQIKQAVTNGNLWQSKVSSSEKDSENNRRIHAIMIYTKDYTDLVDVINVLSFLEDSGIKPPHEIIRYKTDQQTRAGIYRGGRHKPWIYASDTIRGNASTATHTNAPNWRTRTN